MLCSIGSMKAPAGRGNTQSAIKLVAAIETGTGHARGDGTSARWHEVRLVNADASNVFTTFVTMGRYRFGRFRMLLMPTSASDCGLKSLHHQADHDALWPPLSCGLPVSDVMAGA